MNFIEKLPKTTIATVVGALIVYALGRGYIAQDQAELISILFAAVGVGINTASGKLPGIK